MDELNTVSEPVKLKKSHQVYAALAACSSQLVTGFILAFSSPTIPDLQKENILDSSQASWYGSVICLGGAIGALIAGPMVEKLGRKTTAMCATLPSVAGWGIITYFRSAVLLCVGRSLTGLMMGMILVAVPLYVAEITTTDMRGLLGSVFQLAFTFGNLATFLLGSFLNWQWLALIAIILTTCNSLLMIVTPESPRWLLSHGRRMEAINALHWLRGSDEAVKLELAEMEEILIKQIQESKLSLVHFKEKRVFLPMLIVVGLLLLQQFSGINIVVFYAKTIFLSAGFKDSPNLPQNLVGVVSVLGTFTACLLTDRTGRKALLMFSTFILTISCTTLGLYYFLSQVKNNTTLSWLSLTSVLVYVAAFSVGLGPVPWLVAGEIVPLKTRSLTTSIGVTGVWLSNFLITKEIFDLEAAITDYGTYWLCAGINFGCFVFVMLLLPETKGKTLEEIEKYFDKEKTDIASYDSLANDWVHDS